MNGNHSTQFFYGRFARFARQVLRIFSPKYHCDLLPADEPVVYVCRHLNMHGPYTTLKWIPFHVHPLSLHIFFDKKTAITHLKNYTLSVRMGKKPKKHSLLAWLLGTVDAKLMASLKAVPVYRDAGAIKTVRQGLQYLTRGESLIVWPDIEYTHSYDKPCKIYNGFLFMGEMYEKKTGKRLQFIPLYVDDENRQIVRREAITISNFKQQAEEVTAQLEKALDPLPATASLQA